MNIKNQKGCPHIQEIEIQSYWCCYIKNKMVDLTDCKNCKYGKTIGIIKK